MFQTMAYGPLGEMILSVVIAILFSRMKHSKHEEDPFLRLTEDLILEILYRLPVKSLGRCKVVCKSWLTLISDPEFAKSHLDFSKSNKYNHPWSLISQKHNISSLQFCDPTNVTEGVTLTPLDHQFLSDSVLDSRYCFIVGSSDGIICAYIKEMEERRRGQDSMYLWNPCTTEKMEISLPVRRGSFYVHIDSSWFGCVPSSDDYKIFLVYEVYRPYETCMYMYSLRCGRWREIHYSDEDLDSITSANSVFLNEALHYLVCHEWIVKFDLVTETFKKLPFSIKPHLVPEFNQLLLGVIGEYDCLCAMFVHRYGEWMFELWTLEEYGNWDSWKKLYRIDLQGNIFRNCIQLLGFTYYGDLCIQHANGLVLIDPDDEPPSHVIAQNPSCTKAYKVMDYVETLVSPEYLL